MLDLGFLPTLSSSDIERAAQLIQQGYGSSSQATSPEDIKRIQTELFEIQKLPEAWGLVIPLLNQEDQHVQFFGAHTAQVKIARDWATFPTEHEQSLRNVLVQLTAHCVAIGRSKLILRKLFVTLTTLALKLVPHHPTRWNNWILTCVTSLSGSGAPTEHILDFLAIVAEEIDTASLTGSSKGKMVQSLSDATSMVVQAIQTSISQPMQSQKAQNEVTAALKCLQAWISVLPSSDVTPLIPLLISLLDPENDTAFLAASEALEEIMSKSALSNGSGTKTLTEPLLFWLESTGTRIVDTTLQSGIVEEVSHSLCKLLCALGDHSTKYFAVNIASPTVVAPPPNISGQPQTKGFLSQLFLRLLLAYTGLPGYYGVDEESSELTLGFWYMFQEALWGTDYYGDDEEEENPAPGALDEQGVITKALYVELVRVLRRKVTFPPPGSGWQKDQVDKFQVYRRDVGDTLINAYYIIRDDMLGYLVDDVKERLSSHQEGQPWEDIEASLLCIMSIQEALDYEQTPHLGRLFSPDILGQLPSTGHNRVRRTTLSLIGTYSSWFTTQPPNDGATQQKLLTVVGYIVSALPEPYLCLQAATALRNVCDANRKALAPHIGAFAELHAGLERIPDSEKSKVLQSIASVIQALPPVEEIPTIEVIVNPIVQKLAEALNSPTFPPEARTTVILQLEILCGIAKGLTRTPSPAEGLLLSFEEEPGLRKELDEINAARDDGRMANLRQMIISAVGRCVEVFGSDVGVGQALSDLFKAITSLPSDITLITLPAAPLLELVCLALQRQVTASWLSLATILIAQLSPPPALPFATDGANAQRAQIEQQTNAVLNVALPMLLSAVLGLLGQPGAMEENPDIVQEFFQCLDRVAQDFVGIFYTLPPGALDALLQCATRALTLQERYSSVAACTFISNVLHRSYAHEALAPAWKQMISVHGRSMMRAVLVGIAGAVPRSVVPNLVEMLSTLLVRCAEESKVYLREILFDENFIQTKATPEAKEKFIKTLLGSKSLKRTREAATQFTLVSRGLEGSSFGYASEAAAA